MNIEKEFSKSYFFFITRFLYFFELLYTFLIKVKEPSYEKGISRKKRKPSYEKEIILRELSYGRGVTQKVKGTELLKLNNSKKKEPSYEK